ncbi:MAG: hypothetical protein DMF90_25440 [Acidobacteria bacterium]|nr:MAG: hypothetical protein DMF90_25440 [Acidobacteriota bacterium]
MRAVVLRLAESFPRRYGLEIPVLVIDGRKAAKYRVTEGALRRMLVSRPATSP